MGIAGHIADHPEIQTDKQSLKTHPACRITGFCSGMTATDDDDIILFLYLVEHLTD